MTTAAPGTGQVFIAVRTASSRARGSGGFAAAPPGSERASRTGRRRFIGGSVAFLLLGGHGRQLPMLEACGKRLGRGGDGEEADLHLVLPSLVGSVEFGMQSDPSFAVGTS